MEAFRLSRKIYASTLSGKGAALKGARWNSAGVEILYLATNRSIAMAEVAVHLTLATLPADYMMVAVHIPDDISLAKLTATELPAGWNSFPHPVTTQSVGNQLIAANKCCVLQVPSSVVQGEFNLLINPNHPEFRNIKIVSVEKFIFDSRIFK